MKLFWTATLGVLMLLPLGCEALRGIIIVPVDDNDNSAIVVEDPQELEDVIGQGAAGQDAPVTPGTIPQPVPPLIVEGGVGRELPGVEGAEVIVSIENNSSLAANVTLEFRVGDLLVRLTFLRIRPGAQPIDVGPEFANEITVGGSFASGQVIAERVFRFGEDFTESGQSLTFAFADPPPINPPDNGNANGNGNANENDNGNANQNDNENVNENANENDNGNDNEGEIPPQTPGGGAIVDCNNNGVADAEDIANGTSLDCNGSGVPDECEGLPPAEGCCTPITLGQIVDRVFNFPGQEQCFTLNGFSGQRVYFEPLGSEPTFGGVCTEGSIFWEAKNPEGGQVFSRRELREDWHPGAFQLPLNGVYTVKVDAGSGTAGAFSFRVLDANVPPQPFALTFNQVTSGVLATPVESDVYTFAATAGQLLFFDPISADLPAPVFGDLGAEVAGGFAVGRWKLQDPQGGTVFDSFFFGFEDFKEMPLTGTYTLQITTGNAPGMFYEFRVHSRTNPPTMIAVGDTVNGQFDVFAEVDVYQFTPDILRQNVFFRAVDGPFSAIWEGRRPDGSLFFDTTLNACCSPGWRTLDQAGTYELRVLNSGGFTGPTYSFELLTAQAPNVFEVEIDGPPIAGILASPVEQDVYEFAGTMGEPLYIDVTSGSFDITWRVDPPFGDPLFGDTFFDPAFDPNYVVFGGPGVFTLPETGTYRVTLAKTQDFGASAYGFRLVTPPAPESFDAWVGATIPNSIELPDGTPGFIDGPGAVDSYRFFPESSGPVFFDVLSPGGGNLYWKLEDEFGSTLFGFEQMTSFSDRGPFNLDSDAEYFITVFSSSGVPADYSFKILDVPPPVPCAIDVGVTVSNGLPCPQSGNIDSAYDVDMYIFDVVTPDLPVYFQVLAGNSNLQWTLENPQLGGEIFRRNLSGDAGTFVLQPGLHRITVNSDFGGTGSYAFTLVIPVAPTPCLIAIDQRVPSEVTCGGAGNIDSPVGRDVYLFDGVSGDEVYFDVQASNWDLCWSCLGPLGENIFSNVTMSTFDPGLRMLPTSGLYTIIVESRFGGIGSYGFEIVSPVLPTAFPIPIGQRVSDGVPAVGAGRIDGATEADIYTFQALAGQNVFFDQKSGDWTVWWECKDAEGFQVFGPQQLTFDPGLRTLTLGGTYTITVTTNTGDPSTYSFIVRLENDRCENAICIGEGATPFDTTYATDCGPDDCDAFQDVWFEHVAECNGNLTISLCGSSFDTLLGVYDADRFKGCPSSLVECIDNTCGLQSEVTLPVEIGDGFLIHVGGAYIEEAGPGTLNITCIP